MGTRFIFLVKGMASAHNTSEPENLVRGYDLEIRTHLVVCKTLIYQAFSKSYNSTPTTPAGEEGALRTPSSCKSRTAGFSFVPMGVPGLSRILFVSLLKKQKAWESSIYTDFRAFCFFALREKNLFQAEKTSIFCKTGTQLAAKK